MKKSLLNLFTYSLALFLLVFGFIHFNSPDSMTAFFPDAVPRQTRLFLIYLSGAAEIILGTGLFMPRFRKMAALLTIVMLIVYLPLHIRDLFLKYPAIGSKNVAIIRVFVQFILIYLLWLVSKTKPPSPEND
ncbi:MAG: hypothetical protein ABI687_02570 [Flavitalea sp.]